MPRCPRCGGMHPEMYEPVVWGDDDFPDDEEAYPREGNGGGKCLI